MNGTNCFIKQYNLLHLLSVRVMILTGQAHTIEGAYHKYMKAIQYLVENCKLQ